jgi:competence protein ComEC
MTRCLREAGVERLTVLLTHFHADHIDGLAAVLEDWPVDEILATPVPEPVDAARDVLSTARTENVPLRTVRTGHRTTAGGVEVAILWPARRMTEAPINNASVVALAVLRTAAGPLRVLLTGDIEPAAQAVLLGTTPPAAAVVKVPHHGSRYQLEQFAAWSGARIALISAGAENEYGHPSPATIQQYRRAGALVGRTDQHGDMAVTVIGDGGVALHTRR